MPRPNKAGLDYFPLDVDIDEKLELIEAKHGLLGFGLVVKLFQAIYKNGYYMNASEERLLLLKKKVNVDINFINDVISDGCKWGLFDEQIFKDYSVLTSCGIQKRYVEATKRRKDVEFITEYLKIQDVKSKYPEKVNVCINPLNTYNSTQSKVKKRKEYNISSELQSNSEQEPTILEIPLIKKDGLFQIVQSDIDQWQDTYPGVDVMLALKDIRQWNLDNPAKRKTIGGIRKHISTWLSRAQNQGKYKRQTKSEERVYCPEIPK